MELLGAEVGSGEPYAKSSVGRLYRPSLQAFQSAINDYRNEQIAICSFLRLHGTAEQKYADQIASLSGTLCSV